MWVERFTSYACYKVIDGVPMSARAQSLGSREHSAEIWFVARPINYKSYTTLSKLYMHGCKCNWASLYAYLSTSVRSSPKRRLTGTRIACESTHMGNIGHDTIMRMAALPFVS